MYKCAAYLNKENSPLLLLDMAFSPVLWLFRLEWMVEEINAKRVRSSKQTAYIISNYMKQKLTANYVLKRIN